jgi:dihydrolipoamide dehydrogenase
MDDEVSRGSSPTTTSGRVAGGSLRIDSSLRLAVEMAAVLKDIAGTIGVHPTRSEAITRLRLALGSHLHF